MGKKSKRKRKRAVSKKQKGTRRVEGGVSVTSAASDVEGEIETTHATATISSSSSNRDTAASILNLI
jgi:hypothetical protein